MTEIQLFPFGQYLGFYVAFTLVVLGLLALDLGVLHRKAHRIRPREALTLSIFWIALAIVFGIGFYFYCSHALPLDPRLMGLDHATLVRDATLQYFSGYLIEKALAVDNLFVFVVIFSYFSIPAEYQHRVLALGIMGALVFRALFIALAAFLLQYHWVVILFGAVLIFTGMKIFFADHKPMDPSKNFLMKIIRRFLPVTHQIHGSHFWIRENGRLLYTPLFVALIFIESCDIVFAVDSIPAIFAITREPLIVFTSNVFAILGLRAMYFLVADIVDRFYLLKYALGLILVFVGLKMVWLNDAFDGKFPITWSLGIISGLLGASIVLSIVFRPRTPVI